MTYANGASLSLLIDQISKSDLDDAAKEAMQGKGTALKPYLDSLGLEDRLRFLRSIVQRSRDFRQTDKSLPALLLSIQWRAEDDVVADSKLNHHLQVQLRTEVIKFLPGGCIYQEKLFVHHPSTRREVQYQDLEPAKKRPAKEKIAKIDHAANEFEERNLKMCVPIIERLLKAEGIEEEAVALEKLKSTEWIDEQGYGHIAHILGSATGWQACRQVFAKRETLKNNTAGDTSALPGDR